MYGRRERVRLCRVVVANVVVVVFVGEGGWDVGDSCLDIRTGGERRGGGVGSRGGRVDDEIERENSDGAGSQGEGEGKQKGG